MRCPENVVAIRRMLDKAAVRLLFWMPHVRFMAEFTDCECRQLAHCATQRRSPEKPASKSESRSEGRAAHVVHLTLSHPNQTRPQRFRPRRIKRKYAIYWLSPRATNKGAQKADNIS